MLRFTVAAVTAGLLVLAVLDCGITGHLDENTRKAPNLYLPDPDTEGTIRLSGSVSVGPTMQAFAEVFKKQCPELKITFRLSGSGDGISDLVDGKCDIAMLSRPLKLSEYRAAVAMGVLPCLHTIEMDALAVIVHPGNPIKGLTREQIRDIYTGKITNWKQVGGHDLVIVPVSKDSSSGSCETFHRLVMNARKMSAVVETTPRSPQMHGRLKDTSGAIGYVGLGFLDKSVKALAVDGVFPSRAAILDGSYPVTRPMYLLTDGMPRVGSPIWKLIHFRFGREGHDIIESKGFFPVTRYKPRQQGRCIERASCMACSPK